MQAINKKGEGFNCFFIEPQIRKLLDDVNSIGMLLTQEFRAWNAVLSVVRGFSGNNIDANHEQLINELLDPNKSLGC